MKRMGKGIHMVAAAELLAIIAMVVYGKTLYRDGLCYIVLGGSAAVFVVLGGFYLKFRKELVLRLLILVNAILLALGFVQSFGPMANELGYVVSGLDPISAITGFIVYAVITFAGMVLYIISSYMNLDKEV